MIVTKLECIDEIRKLIPALRRLRFRLWILVAANALLEALKLHTVHYALDQEKEVHGNISKEDEQEESVHLFIKILLIAFGDSRQ